MTYSLAHRPVGYLGQVEGSAAGEINGVALLLADLRDVATRGGEFMQPGFSFSRARFEAMMSAFRTREGETESAAVERVRRRYSEMSGEEIQLLIAGTVGAIGQAVVRATAVSRLRVVTEAERAQNHALQASIVDPARFMWDMLSQMLRNMEARRAQNSAAGLGAIPVAVVVAAAVVGAVLGIAAITAGTYLADSFFRAQYASREAERICNRAGGCTAEQEASIRRTLQLGPFDTAFREFGAAAGEGLGTTIVVLGVGGAVVVGGALWYYALGGRQWLQDKARQRSMRRLPA